MAGRYADEVGKANPKYNAPATRQVEGMASRPHRDNCIRAVIAMEMRIRGHDVTAGAGPYATKVRVGDLEGARRISFSGDANTPDLVPEYRGKGPVESPKDQAENAIRGLPHGARGTISATVIDQTADRQYGHVWMWEKSGDEIRVFDPQSGLVDATENFDRVVPGTVEMHRLDHLPLTDDALYVVGGDEDVWL